MSTSLKSLFFLLSVITSCEVVSSGRPMSHNAQLVRLHTRERAMQKRAAENQARYNRQLAILQRNKLAYTVNADMARIFESNNCLRPEKLRAMKKLLLTIAEEFQETGCQGFNQQSTRYLIQNKTEK